MGFRLKGQVAMEFVMMVMLGFMILVVFSAVTRDQYSDIQKEGEYVSLRDVVGMVQAEINTAFGVSDGYERIFLVSETLNGLNYSMSIMSGFIMGESDNFEVIMMIPPVQGNISKGNNIIQKRGGEVFLTQSE